MGLFKHPLHIFYMRDIPLRNICIKLRFAEHSFHVDDIRNVPLGNISVELGAFEHFAHIDHVGNIPFGDVSVEMGFAKYSARVCNLRDVDKVQVRLGVLLDFFLNELLEFFFCFDEDFFAGLGGFFGHCFSLLY